MLVSVTGIRKMERGNLRAFADVAFGDELVVSAEESLKAWP